ncbi:MAG: M15 family metallopeptidase [Treponemataceae bacterium]
MPVNKNIDLLSSECKKKCIAMQEKLKEVSIPFMIIETLRTHDVQLAYFMQGRFSLKKVNQQRKKADLYLLSEDENKKTVTSLNPNITKSKHMTGNAFDLVILLDSNKIDWNKSKPELWILAGRIGKMCGLQWGGDWKPFDKHGIGWDAPHYEI